MSHRATEEYEMAIPSRPSGPRRGHASLNGTETSAGSEGSSFGTVYLLFKSMVLLLVAIPLQMMIALASKLAAVMPSRFQRTSPATLGAANTSSVTAGGPTSSGIAAGTGHESYNPGELELDALSARRPSEDTDLMALALKTVAETYEPDCPDGLLLMHDDDLMRFLPTRDESHNWGAEEIRSHVKRRIRESPAGFLHRRPDGGWEQY